MHHQHAAQHELPRALGPASPTVHACGLSEYRFRQPHVLTLCFQGLEDGEGGARDVAGNVGFKHFFGCGLYVWDYREDRGRVLQGLWNSILWA